MKDILIVDDEKFVCMALSKELEEQTDYNVDSALSGREAIDKAKNKKYNLFFVDLSMPEMDGIETTKQLKEISPDSEYVCFTGIFNRVLNRRGADFIEANGKTRLLYKPFREKTFLETAEQILVG